MNIDTMQQEREHSRIDLIDRMRGAALLGILLVNMISFHTPLLYIDPLEWWIDYPGRAAYIFTDVFVQASFYPLFSLLFGFSMVLFRKSVITKGFSFYPVAFRRLGFLLAVGILHMAFIWHGDILITYAICGFLLLPFLGASNRSLLRIGVLLYAVPNLLLGLLLLDVPAGSMALADQEAIRTSLEVYRTGSFAEITARRIQDWYYVNNPVSLLFIVLSIFPLFLIGAGAAKTKWFTDFHLYKKQMKYALILFLAAGITLKLFPYTGSRTAAAEYFQDLFGGVLLAVTYALLIGVLGTTKLLAKYLEPLAAVGKMSLSNYLLQSFLLTLVFYSYGLGFYGDMPIFWGTILALLFYTAQVAVSRWWMSRYYYGPVEWIWRNFTYLKLQKLNRKTEKAKT